MTLGVLCGFQAEVDCLERVIKNTGLDRSRFDIAVSGSSAKRAREKAENLIEKGAKRLLSFGIAGGLDPRLRVGDVVFSRHVVTLMDESYGIREAEGDLLSSLRAGPEVMAASLCGVDTIAFSALEKARIFKASKAAAADMESHALARAATKAGLPFFVVRAISDSAQDELPYFVGNAVTAKGKPRLAPIVIGLCRNPMTLRQLLQLKHHTDHALKALEKAGGRLLPPLLA